MRTFFLVLTSLLVSTLTHAAVTLTPARQIAVRTNGWSNIVVGVTNAQETFDWIDVHAADTVSNSAWISWKATNGYVTSQQLTTATNVLTASETGRVASTYMPVSAWNSWLTTNNLARGFAPDSGVVEIVRFAYSGTNMGWTVPTNATSLDVYCWGAGGGGGSSALGIGGFGGYASGCLQVTNATGLGYVSTGALLTVVVGGGGNPTSSASGIGFGGAAGGGGGSFVCSNGTSVVLIAAGGGGAGGGRTPALAGGYYELQGGAGGGDAAGRGVAGVSNSYVVFCGSGATSVGGGSGARFYGSDGIVNPNAYLAAGGGGGGYYGGARGTNSGNTTPYLGGAGGGGSGYVGGVLGGITTTASTNRPAGASSIYYSPGVGYGAIGSFGSPGYVVIVVK